MLTKAALPLFILELCLMIASTSRAAVNRPDGSLSDTNIRYVGRWDRRDPAIAHSYWSNTYLRAIFTGTKVKARIAGHGDMTVSIDGEPVRVLSGTDVVDLVPAALAAGDHTLLLGANSQNGELKFAGLVLDQGATTKPTPAKPLLEFIGDSITACQGKGGGPTDNYAWETGEALNCDHTQIAFSGKGLRSGWGALPDKTGFDVHYFRLMNCNHPDTELWDFSTYTPRLLILNLGTNEVKDGKRATDAEFKESFTHFVHDLRAKFPQTEIAALRPFSGFVTEGLRQAVASLNDAGDRRVHYLDTTGWLNLDPATGKLNLEDSSDGLHPSVQGHAKVAKRLTAVLAPMLRGTN